MSFELGEKEEYVRLATENLENGVAPRRRHGWRLFVIAAVALTAWIAVAYHYGMSDGLMISVTIAVATMCLIRVLNTWATALMAGIVYNCGAIEWFGQKHLDRQRVS